MENNGGSSAGSDNNHYLKDLKTNLEALHRAKKQAEIRIAELLDFTGSKKPEIENIERAIAESKRIAQEIEDTAHKNAESILASARASVALKKEQIAAVEEELADLHKELDSHAYPEDSSQIGTAKRSLDLTHVHQKGSDNKGQKQPLNGSSPYSMRLSAFVNARHYVTFGEEKGPVHAHSWQVAFQVRPSYKNQEITSFSLISQAASSVLIPYENVILNDVPPFDKIQPTTENIAMYFYNRLEDAFAQIDLDLVEMTLWETPIRGVHVCDRNAEFDRLPGFDGEVREGYQQAAAGLDSGVAAAGKEKSDSPSNAEIPRKQEEPVKVSPKLPSDPIRPAYSFRQYMLGILIISAVCFLVYYKVLFPPSGQHYPWGSDSWGHLFKAESLYESIKQGNYFPQFTEYWYNGCQPFRYWAPLPYYVLAFFRLATGDIFTAGNLYIVICAFLGGISWLFLSRRMGLWPAVMAGTVWAVWQDNVRIAFSEGNLPRVLATAVLPVLFAFFLNVLQEKRAFPSIIISAFLIQAVILSHAMIGAIYCICLVLFAFFLWCFHGCSLSDFMRGGGTLAVGVLSSSWWLLPSLSGGITGIDAEAVKEVIQFVPAVVSLSPLYRFSNIEIFYWGIALVFLLVFSFIAWKSKPPWAKSLAICGLLTVLITFPLFREFFVILPLSHLLWPLRFSSFAALAVLASGLTFNLLEHRQRWLKSNYTCGLVITVFFAALVADCWVSLSLLAHTGPLPFNIIHSANYIKQNPGWRVATIDLSQLGSSPSYLFSASAGMEQVFGWAWQGAVTSRNIMLLNTSLENQYYPFLFRSCVDLGATDLVVKEDVVEDVESFRKAASMAGYKQHNRFGEISVWKSAAVNRPYAIVKNPKCLVIGKYAGTIALQFPEVEMGLSHYIDDYQAVDLSKYDKVILSGATWKSKRKAEQVIKNYAALGGEVFVELAGMPEDVLAKQPEFLGVYGEPVSIREEIEIQGKDKRVIIPPVLNESKEWKTYVPMGLDKVELEFYYYGNQAPVFGYKLVDNCKIWFLGYNMSYHAYITGNSYSFQLIKEIFDLNSEYTIEPLIPFQYYEAAEKGYKMKYDIAEEVDAVVPIAVFDGLGVKIDGEPVAFGNYENLLQLKLPAGSHEIGIHIEKSPAYKWGNILSLFSVFLAAAGLIYLYKREKGEFDK